MKPPGAVIPVYPTAFGLQRRNGKGSTWRQWFPFSAAGGRWTLTGRVALYHGLPTLKLPPQSTILVPSYHQGVEVETLLAAGYRVRYYRVDERLSIDFSDLEHRLDRTASALYVIHYFGFAQPLEPIRRFCEAYRLRLIEDCALSLFSRDNGTWLGSIGDLGLFSVYKTLPLPHGGFLVTKEAHRIAELRAAPLASTVAQTLDLVHYSLRASRWARVERWVARSIRWGARIAHWDRSRMIASGGATWDPRLLRYNASAWATWLMRFIDPEVVVAARRANFTRLASHLRGRVPCPVSSLPAGVCPLFFPIMVPDKIQFQRDLEGLGVRSVNLWDASHPTCPPDLAAEVSHWRRHCLEIPIHQELTPADMDRLADAVLVAHGRQC